MNINALMIINVKKYVNYVSNQSVQKKIVDIIAQKKLDIQKSINAITFTNVEKIVISRDIQVIVKEDAF